ncbi:MAG: hypothetical protein SF162_11510 [bacterium]|nr:hypothetical protein [bacterium]
MIPTSFQPQDDHPPHNTHPRQLDLPGHDRYIVGDDGELLRLDADDNPIYPEPPPSQRPLAIRLFLLLIGLVGLLMCANVISVTNARPTLPFPTFTPVPSQPIAADQVIRPDIATPVLARATRQALATQESMLLSTVPMCAAVIPERADDGWWLIQIDRGLLQASRIMRMLPDGTGACWMYPNPIYGQVLHFSPDGTRMMYSTPDHGVYVLRFDTRTTVPYLEFTEENPYPSPVRKSPDGTRRLDVLQWQLWLMTDGGGAARIPMPDGLGDVLWAEWIAP